jgi:hypothetical protein
MHSEKITQEKTDKIAERKYNVKNKTQEDSTRECKSITSKIFQAI